MSLETVKAAIVKALDKEYRETRIVRVVQSHRGRFDSIKEIQRLALVCPALLVCADGLASIRESCGRGGGLWGEAGFFIYVLTRDLPNAPRDQQTERLMGQLAHTVFENDWGQPDRVQTTDRSDARNLTTTPVDKLGISLWAIGWKQQILVDPAEEPFLFDFEQLNVTWDIDAGEGEPVATDTITLAQESPQ